MSPIDRVTLRAQAFSTLGLSASATLADIRASYRKLAFEKHPDHDPANHDEFARITQAYKYVCDHADELGIRRGEKPAQAPAPRRVSRPAMRAEEATFDEKCIAECRALLETRDKAETGHVASAIYRRGRELTYFVPTQLAKGRNAVAVPTGMLRDARRVLPKVIAFDALDAAGGTYEVPSALCAAEFPGARRMQICFAAV